MFLSIVTQHSILARTPVSEDDAQVLLRLRNALSHTFGLYCEGKGGVHIPLVVISSDQPDEQLVHPREDGGHEICLERLVRLFIRIVAAFQAHIEQTQTLHQPFMMNAFHKYGRLYQQGPHVP